MKMGEIMNSTKGVKSGVPESMSCTLPKKPTSPNP